MNISKLDEALKAFNVPDDNVGKQLNDEEIEEEAERLAANMQPKVKDKEVEDEDDDSNSEDDDSDSKDDE